MTRFRAIVLAGERPGGNALARALGLPAGVLAPLAGRPCILWVLDAVRGADSVGEVVLCGPARPVLAGADTLAPLVADGQVDWLEPADGPAASALAAARGGPYPQLLTSGDHGLLSAAIVDAFCQAAARVGAPATTRAAAADLVVGLVPYDMVAAAYPDSPRTVLRFADGAFCGSNLFALLSPASEHALAFWRAVEADRKRPWRIARRLGPATLLRYLSRRLPVAEAFAVLSRHAGCRVTWVEVPTARAAVDVDSEADWRLADRVLSGTTPSSVL